MKPNLDRFYITTLYITLGTLIPINALTLVSGSLLALIPLIFQGTIIYAVRQYKPWAADIVIVWAALLTISGFASLIAASLDDVAFTPKLLFRILGLALGLFFVFFAKKVFFRRAAPAI